VSVPQTNALSYNGFIQALATLAVMQTASVGGVLQFSNDPSGQLNDLIPNALNYSELRIQREAQLLPLQTSNGYTLTAGQNTLSIPTSDFVIAQTLWVNVDGSLIPLTPVSKEWLQNVYPGMGTQGPPEYFAPIGGDFATAGMTSNIFQLGPVPDSAYPLTIFGMIRMPSLYQFSDNEADATTKYTFISQWMPDALLAAAMIYVTGFQRDFGAMGQVDEAGMGVSWEAAYKTAMSGVQLEEAQKKFQASAWSSMPPATLATPDR
jgi:hypothetical protein